MNLLFDSVKTFDKITVKINRPMKHLGDKVPGYQFRFNYENSTIHPLIILTNNIL